MRLVPRPGAMTGVFLCFCLAAGTALSDDTLSHRDDLSAKDRIKAAKVLQPPADFEAAEAFEIMQGGAGTSRKRINRDAYSHSNANLTFEEQATFKVGNGLFKKLWASSPSSTQASDGLGPLYNARSCQGCHLKDGRGRPPRAGEDAVSMFLRLSIPPQSEAQRQALADKDILLVPEPTYGGQFQTFAVPGLPGEGRFDIEVEEIEVPLAGGEKAVLQKPVYKIRDLGYGDMHPDTMISARAAPPMIGLGLVQAIHPGDIEALADPDDIDSDGISGKVSRVRDPATGALTLGRFGWKASKPSIRAQSAAAFAGDIGISTPEMPDNYGDCTKAQTACRALPHGEQVNLGVSEAPDPVMDLVTFYSENLAVPMRRDVDDPEVLKGKQVFYQSGCPACHQPKYVTSRKAENPAHRFQLIWPYSDFLLHDMGEGLADNRPVGDASGQEWRTPPLWGIGLTETVNNHTRFLHDGRARNLLEAVLWHDGEARQARDAVVALSPADRQSLIRFLESL
ncbi:di-heme oxidoreductase family protein [Roseibium aggregatum]|uniref:Putative thiol oxidoreductase n=1 Tax=Roseibium aggregatum TaxID=187304 RepID=A0A0M6YA34_9HYPH|nr:di-heme oxidoredictase family protein [Roseibium aggregatum]CTQ46279.1 putative thiol oxidoreductase [Roseibium aggregatum]